MNIEISSQDYYSILLNDVSSIVIIIVGQGLAPAEKEILKL